MLNLIMNDNKLAYLAGLFDGEGAIYMSGRKIGASVVMSFTNTNLALCELFRERWGGNISNQLPKNSNKAKQVNRWYRMGRNAKPCLEELCQFLIAKKPLALLALQYLDAQIGSGNVGSAEKHIKKLKLSQSIYKGQQRQRLL